MKIFNWVHRKFHCNNIIVSSTPHKDELCTRTIEKVAVDKQALLGQEVALVDVLGGWKDGILTIGTLGFDESLKSFPFNYSEIEEVDDEEEEDHEEQEDDERENDDEGEHCPLVLRPYRESLKEEVITFDEVITDCERPSRKKNGERTTLADLFSADSDDYGGNREHDHHISEVLPKSKSSSSSSSGHAEKKKAIRSTKKKVVSFPKKLIPRVGDDSRPIKKLNQLMTRMLKRKIHPEVEGKNLKSDGQIKPNARGLLSSDGIGSNEDHSLCFKL